MLRARTSTADGAKMAALGEDELGGVETAAKIAVIEVSATAQALERMPERINVPPRQPGGQQCQRECPSLPGFREHRLVDEWWMHTTPPLGSSHVSDPIHGITFS